MTLQANVNQSCSANDYAEQNNVDPPPTYYEAMAARVPGPSHMESQAKNPMLPKLTYIDFVPDDFSSKYPDLIEKANYWLSQNRGFSLQSCESVVMPVKGGKVRADESTHRIPMSNGRDYTHILRCWLLKADVPNIKPQVIRTLARVPPTEKSLSITIGSSYAMDYSGFDSHSPTFKPLSECLEKLNEDLENNPLPGKILRVETLTMKVTESMSMVVNLNPDILHWTESGMLTSYAFYVRLFYVEGEPVNEKIGWKDFVPPYTLNPSNVNRPKFASFSETFNKAGQWTHMQKDKSVTNVQTVDTPVVMDPLFPMSARRPVIHSGRSQITKGNSFSLLQGDMIVRFLRVFYVSTADSQREKPYCMTHRLFVPYRLTTQTFEVPADNIRRLGVWMSYNESNSAISDNNIICAESIMLPTNLSSKMPVDMEKSMYLKSANQFVSAIRLYIDGGYQEPPLHVIGYPPPVVFPVTTTCCTLL